MGRQQVLILDEKRLQDVLWFAGKEEGVGRGLVEGKREGKGICLWREERKGRKREKGSL